MAEEPIPRGPWAGLSSRLLPLVPVAVIAAVAAGAGLGRLPGILLVLAVLLGVLGATVLLLAKPNWSSWAKAVVASGIVGLAAGLGLILSMSVHVPSRTRQPALSPRAPRALDANATPRLAGTDLKNAKLRGVDLRRANLRGADLRGVDFSGACLRGADFSGARIDSKTRFAGADLTNALPTSLDKMGSPTSGACDP